MKLLRFYKKTDGDEGSFLGKINDDIILKPDSKLGLINTSIRLFYQELNINTENQVFNFTTTNQNRLNANEDIVTLANGNYSSTELLQEINSKMNSVLDNGYDPIGFEWNLSLIDKKLNMSYCVKPEEPDDRILDINPNISRSVDIYKKTSGSAGVLDAYSVSRFPFSRGLGSVFFNLTNINTGNTYIGFTDTPPNVFGTTTFDPSTLYYGVNIRWNGLVNDLYQIKDGVAVDTFNNINNGDTLEFELDLGELLTYTNGLEITNSDYVISDYNYEGKFSYLVVAQSLLNSEVEIIQYTKSPYYSSTTTGINYTPHFNYDNNFGQYNGGIIEANTRRVEVQFPNNLYQLLGFISNDYKLVGDCNTLTAEKTIGFSVLPNNILLLLENYVLDSIDLKSDKERQRSILAVINSEDITEEGEITYTPPVNKIDLGNAEEINLKQLRLKLVNAEDDEELPIEDACITIGAYDEKGL